MNGGSFRHYGVGAKSRKEIACHMILMEIVCTSYHTIKIGLWLVVLMGDPGNSGIAPKDKALRELGG
jgi:hypothetical protein